MSNSNFSSGGHTAGRRAQPRERQRWSSRGTWLLVGAAALQGACSLLIEIDDGLEDNTAPDAATAQSPNQPLVPQGDAAVLAPEAHLDAGTDAEVDAEAGALAAPALALAFIERPEEGEASLRLVDARAALGARSGELPAWRRTLRPEAQAGHVLDFAWSPDGRRLAVRHDTLDGPRLALFVGPDWRELPVAAASPASLPRLTVAPGYRWAPDGSALAVELASEQGPFVGGYVVSDASAREIGPVPFTGPVESLEWLTPSSLFVIQPDAGEPELLELALEEGAFASPVDRFLLGAFFPIELRRSPGGVIGASPDPTHFVFFWPETPDAGFESAFTPSAFLSSRESFAAEPDDAAALSRLSPIGDSALVLDTLPECPVVLAWSEGPNPSSLAGSRIVCLNVSGEVATLTLHVYDAGGARQARVLEDAGLLADYALAANWENHARVALAGGDWLALATAQHDAIVDLRGPSPLFEVRSAATAASTALAFSPSGRYLLAQRGAQIELTVLSPSAELSPIHLPLPPAAAELAACDLARHVPTFCGSPRAARRAAARWSASEDVAALLSAGEGLMLLAPTDGTLGLASVPVSTCGSGCVEQYEFAE